jgi:hypothetical protein
VDVTEETADPGVKKAICGTGNKARSHPP